MSVLVFVLGLLCVLFAIAVMERARRFRAPAIHIWLVATSYITLVVLTIYTTEELNEQVWACVAFLMGIASLLTMIRHYRRKAAR